MSPDTSQVWFITGASTGLGRAVTTHALLAGHRVVATLRTPSALSALQAQHDAAHLLVLPLDVTDARAVKAAFARAVAVFGRVDVVYNNAGWTYFGEVEGEGEGGEEAARTLFEVNFWGAVCVAREAVKTFREVNPRGAGGRLLQVSSLFAHEAIPVAGFYCASKAALEAITESLSKELDPEWNVKITTLVPGLFPTAIVTPTTLTLPPHPAYTSPSNASFQTRQWLAEAYAPSNSVEKYAACVLRVARAESPPGRLVLGMDAVERVRGALGRLGGEVEGYEGWSEGMSL
ncbi:hypothetical protein OF83DRAFT_1083979 [Amylostereum chailletii]|nr:hypothetical protein OF83DRAFT_1083979 [Amylostereum chailletii]